MSKSLIGLLVAGLTALTSLIVSVPAVAGEKAVHYERSSVVGDRNEIHAWNVPIVDKNGKTKCWDMVISVQPNGDGEPPYYADITSSKCPKVSNKVPQEGIYVDPANPKYTCELTNFALQTGRTQTRIDCSYEDASKPATLMFDDGDISETHEFYEQLTAAGIDERADVANYYWGIAPSVTTSDVYIDTCGVYDTNDVIGMQQQGDSVIVYLFNTNSSLNCTSELELQN